MITNYKYYIFEFIGFVAPGMIALLSPFLLVSIKNGCPFRSTIYILPYSNYLYWISILVILSYTSFYIILTGLVFYIKSRKN